MLVVQALVAEDHDEHLGEAELASACHIELYFLLQGFHVGLVVQLDPVGLLHLDLQLTAGLHDALVDVVGSVVIAAAVRVALWSHVTHDPLLMTQVYCLLDWQPSHHVFVDVYYLILLKNLWFRQNCLTP